MKELNKKNSFINRLLLFSFVISLVVFIFLYIIYLSQPNLQPIDMSRWKYEKNYGFYYQNDIIYYNNLIDVTTATLSIYYPKTLLKCRDEYKFYKCKHTSDNDTMAMFLLDYNETLPKERIKSYTDLDIIVIKPNFHNPYKSYDIILSISEIKASIKYISSNLDKNQLYVIGYGIFGEICNILGASINNENFNKFLNKLETEDDDEKIHGIISIMPLGGFDIGDSGFEWLIGDKREILDENYKKIQNDLIKNYENYLEKIFYEEFSKNKNNQTQKNFTNEYKNEIFKIYNLSSIDMINVPFPIYDEIIGKKYLKKLGNFLFGNYKDEKPQHFDEILSYFVKNNNESNFVYTDFSKKNNFGENLNVTERVNLASPLYYINNYTDIVFWKIFSDNNFIKSAHFPNEYNLYRKLNDTIKFDTNYSMIHYLKNETFHNLTLMVFNEIKNNT